MPLTISDRRLPQENTPPTVPPAKQLWDAPHFLILLYKVSLTHNQPIRKPVTAVVPSIENTFHVLVFNLHGLNALNVEAQWCEQTLVIQLRLHCVSPEQYHTHTTALLCIKPSQWHCCVAPILCVIYRVLGAVYTATSLWRWVLTTALVIYFVVNIIVGSRWDRLLGPWQWPMRCFSHWRINKPLSCSDPTFL